jgi:isoquinoline 1-oxidoreductase beta subunit
MGVTRRAFMIAGAAAGGGGLLLGFRLWRRSRRDEPRPDAYIRIGTDGLVTLIVDESEMGQGVSTALPMILAEELCADWPSVRYEQAPVDPPSFGDQWTASSTSVRAGYLKLRRAGAAAREMLVAAAAALWGVPAGECVAERGVVAHRATGRTARYAELSEAAGRRDVPPRPRLKDARDFQIIGTPRQRLDLPAKVDGRAVFGLDVRVPDMLVAQVERCPVFGGRLESYDATAARAAPGVRMVAQIPSGIAVIADHYYAAQQGRRALRVAWAAGERGELSSATIAAELVKGLDGGKVLRRAGDARRVIAASARAVRADYLAPYLAHAPMEPLNCTAHVRDGACEIWAPTQSPLGARDAAAQVLGIPPERVTVHTTLLGGGFGRRSAQDFVIEAVHASRAARRPVKVVWSREDDIRGGEYRLAAANRMSAALDEGGWPVAWVHAFAHPTRSPEPEGADTLPYEIADILVEGAAIPMPISTRAWRSVAHSINAWAVECFVDELAAAGGKDPVALRRRLLGAHPRHRRVVELAAERAGWGEPLPAGHARGLAMHESFGTIVAEVAEVSLRGPGVPRVHRVTCVVDCGQVVNPDTVVAQMEGGIVFGLSAALHGQVSIDRGRAVESNFHDYRVLRFPDMPRIDTHIVPSGEPPGGIGEPSTPPIAPAVCNALRALTGQPIRSLPIEG